VRLDGRHSASTPVAAERSASEHESKGVDRQRGDISLSDHRSFNEARDSSEDELRSHGLTRERTGAGGGAKSEDERVRGASHPSTRSQHDHEERM
jgi:hypothetical protein